MNTNTDITHTIPDTTPDIRPDGGAATLAARPAGRRTMARLGAGIAGIAIVVAACGSDDAPATEANEPPVQTAAPAAEAPAAAPAPQATPQLSAVTIGSSAFGDILVGEGGLTLYGFTNDVDAISTCYGTCAEAWPPLLVGPDWTPAPGLDAGIFATTTRDDGTLQLVAGKWPLYYFAGDTAAGDTNGQGSGDVWFVVGTDGILIEGADAAGAEEAAPAAEASVVEVADSAFGSILVDSNGLTLYGFTEDTDGTPTCEAACADAWPPLIVDELPAGLDPNVFSVVPRPDGTNQLKAGAWPLYLFAGDAAAGDTNGQGSGDVWFVVDPDGGLVKETVAESVVSVDSAGEGY